LGTDAVKQIATDAIAPLALQQNGCKTEVTANILTIFPSFHFSCCDLVPLAIEVFGLGRVLGLIDEYCDCSGWYQADCGLIAIVSRDRDVEASCLHFLLPDCLDILISIDIRDFPPLGHLGYNSYNETLAIPEEASLIAD